MPLFVYLYSGRQIDSAFDDDFKLPQSISTPQEMLVYVMQKLELEKKRAADFHQKCLNITTVHRLRVHRARSMVASAQLTVLQVLVAKGIDQFDCNDVVQLMSIFQVELSAAMAMRKNLSVATGLARMDVPALQAVFEIGDDGYFECLRLLAALRRVRDRRVMLSDELNLYQSPLDWNHQEICAWLMSRQQSIWNPDITSNRIFSDMLLLMDPRKAHKFMKAGSERALKQVCTEFKDMCKNQPSASTTTSSTQKL